MKSLAVFVLFSFAISSFASTELSMIEQTGFGKTLLEAVELRLDSQEPVKVLTDMLNGMEKDLAAKQARDDAAHKVYQAKCAEDITLYKRHIAEATSAINEAKEQLQHLRPALVKANKESEAAKHKLHNLEAQLAALISQREKEAKEYKLKVEEHERALVGISKAKALFKSLKAKSSFLQTSTSISSQLRSTVEEMRTPQYQSIFKLLAQVADKAPLSNQELVEKILNLCDKVTANIQASAVHEKKAEEARIEAFNESKAKIIEETNETKATILRLTSLIDNLKKAIMANEDIITQNTAKLHKATKNLHDRTTQCNNETTHYNAATKKRNGERETVAAVLQIVKTKLGNLRNYMNKRIAHVA